MGTISQKIEYLNETKQRQKTLINALGGNITNDTPFREYEKELVGVLPKVTGEGTNISLSPTIEYDLEVESYKGDIYQNTLTGKNLLNYNNLRTPAIDVGFVVDSEGNISDSSPDGDNRGFNYANSNWQMSLEAGTYTMTIIFSKQITSTYGNCRIYDSSDTQLVYFTGLDLQNVSNVSKTFTLSATTNIGIIFKIYSGVCKIQLEKSSSPTTWEKYCGGIPSPNPNYPQDIQVVTGTQEIKVGNKNLYNDSTSTTGKAINSTGSIVDLASFKISDYIEAISSTQYTLSFISTYASQTIRLHYYDKDKNWLSQTNIVTGSTTGVQGTLTGTTPNNCKYIRISIYKDYTNIQLEVGSSASTYSPYTSQTYTLHLGNEELAKIGTYQDKIYYDNGKWYKYAIIGKVVLNGTITENIVLSATMTNTLRVFYQYDILAPSYATAMCNRFQVKSVWATDEEGIYYGGTSNSTNLIMRINKSRLADNTITALNTWLSSNNVLYYYLKREGTTTEITNETLLSDLEYIRTHAMSYSGTTNISSSGNLPVIISARALKGI